MMTFSIFFKGMEFLWLSMGTACLCLAGLLAAERLDMGRLERSVTALKDWGKRHPPAFVSALGTLLILLILFKIGQFQAFHLMLDSAIMGNVLWNAAHGYGLVSSILGGQSYLSVHFAFTLFLLAPIAHFYPSLYVPIVAHGIAVGLSALMVPILGARMTLILKRGYSLRTGSFSRNIGFGEPTRGCWTACSGS